MNTYTCSPEEFMKNARMPVRIMESEDAMMEEIAQIMFDTIRAREGQRTVLILPVGPINQYAPFVRKVNAARLSLKNCWFINMDEYLGPDGKLISRSDILSFRGIMERLLYSQIDPDLLMPPTQRLFPEPGKEKEIDELLEKIGPADCILTGVGINGHIAFNEPPEPDEEITDEEFASIGTRCLPISRETRTNNGANKLRGALDLFPEACITLGMKQLLAAKKIKVYLYCPWQWGIMRKAALEAPTRFAPVTFLQKHPDAEMVVTKDLYHFTLS